MLVYIFFWDTMLCIYCFWVALPHTHFLWDIFENYGLGLGLALFRLGTQMGSAMKKDFDLSWEFFRAFRENLGFETCFKF